MLTDRHHPDLPLEQSLARSLPKNYSPRIMEATPTPLSRSVIRASSRASPLREAWRQAQALRPQSSEEIEVLSQLGDAIKRLRTHDNNVGLAASVPLGTTRRTTASVDLGREMDLLESMGKIEQISRVPRSEALLVLMAEVLVLTLEHASSRAAAQRRGSPPPPSPSPSPQPSALGPQPSALSPQPSALSPRPSALSPQPSALSPQPQPRLYRSSPGAVRRAGDHADRRACRPRRACRAVRAVALRAVRRAGPVPAPLRRYHHDAGAPAAPASVRHVASALRGT
jgi:hypothetical protein